jgi:integrase
LRFRVFFLTTYSLGLRLGDALALEVGDVDAEAERVHVREGKGGKDRLLPLPAWTLLELRRLWLHHHHPRLLFPNPRGPLSTGPPRRWIGAASSAPSRPLWLTAICIASFPSAA